MSKRDNSYVIIGALIGGFAEIVLTAAFGPVVGLIGLGVMLAYGGLRGLWDSDDG